MLSYNSAERARIVETDDASNDIDTIYTMSAGDTFVGSLWEVGDEDAVKLNVDAGVTYTISMDGVGTDALEDPDLWLFDADANFVAVDGDSGSGLNSEITFTATYSGIYYIIGSSFALDYDGDYTISVAETANLNPVSFTITDNGGNDSIDFNSVNTDQKNSLMAETYSDVNGLIGNMTIMPDTVIENAYSGSGNDELIGNDADSFADLRIQDSGAGTLVSYDGGSSLINADDFTFV